MTFWDWVGDNRTKLLGAITTLLSTLTGMIASGMFEGLMEPTSIRWIGIMATLLGVVVGGGTVAVGFSNTTREHIADAAATAAVAKAEGAQQMVVALNAPSPAQPIHVVPVTTQPPGG